MGNIIPIGTSVSLFIFILGETRCLNSIDTHLVINEWDICTVADYWGCIEKFKKKIEEDN